MFWFRTFARALAGDFKGNIRRFSETKCVSVSEIEYMRAPTFGLQGAVKGFCKQNAVWFMRFRLPTCSYLWIRFELSCLLFLSSVVVIVIT